MLQKRGNVSSFGLLWVGLFVGPAAFLVLGCSGDKDSTEEVGSTSEPITSSGPAGSTFFYFRSNSTDWNVDEASRLVPTADPNVFSRTINYSLSYDDSAVISEAFASGPDQWGTQQTYFSTYPSDVARG